VKEFIQMEGQVEGEEVEVEFAVEVEVKVKDEVEVLKEKIVSPIM
jgi:hypothetical protein